MLCEFLQNKVNKNLKASQEELRALLTQREEEIRSELKLV
jgi:hypothetical protein